MASPIVLKAKEKAFGAIKLALSSLILILTVLSDRGNTATLTSDQDIPSLPSTETNFYSSLFHGDTDMPDSSKITELEPLETTRLITDNWFPLDRIHPSFQSTVFETQTEKTASLSDDLFDSQTASSTSDSVTSFSQHTDKGADSIITCAASILSVQLESLALPEDILPEAKSPWLSKISPYDSLSSYHAHSSKDILTSSVPKPTPILSENENSDFFPKAADDPMSLCTPAVDDSTYHLGFADMCNKSENIPHIEGTEGYVSLFDGQPLPQQLVDGANDKLITCRFDIKVPDDLFLNVSFDRFNFSCQYSKWVRVTACYHTGVYDLVYGRFCSYPPPPVFSSTNCLMISIDILPSENTPDIVLKFSSMSTKPELRLEYDSKRSGYLLSPMYDGSEICPLMVNNTVTIPTPPDELVLVSFEDLNLGTQYSCLRFSSPIELESTERFAGHSDVVFQTCGKDISPARFFNNSLIVEFRTSRVCRTSGFKLKFSFHVWDEGQLLLDSGRFNCLMPGYQSIRKHLECNLLPECENEEDEMNCPYTSSLCGSGFEVDGICYKLQTMPKKVTWNQAYRECISNDWDLFSLTAVSQIDNVVRVLQLYNKWSVSYIGLKTSDPNLPKKYRRLLQWSDSRVSFEFQAVSPLVIPACVVLNVGVAATFQLVGCDYDTTPHFICRLDPHSDEVSDWPEATIPPDTNSFNNISFQTCPNGEVILDFVACDPTESCGTENYVTSCQTAAGGLIPMFRCEDQLWAVAYSLLCDYRSDCRDGSDEAFCVFENCLDVKCRNGQCVLKQKYCDGMADCLDQSDEKSCYDRNYLPTGEVYRSLDVSLIILDGYGSFVGQPWNTSLPCPHTHFRCPMSHCLPIALRCNDVRDCPRGEDEIDCNSYTCPGFYRCRGSKICLDDEKVCDGVYHCPLQDDELFCHQLCPSGCRCQGHAFVCRKFFIAERFKRLRYLDASGSEMTLSDLASNFFLVRLSLKNCRLEKIDEVNLPNLRELDLSKNSLTVLTMEEFRGYGNLRVLHLSWNPITRPLERYSGFVPVHPELRHLHLAGLLQSNFTVDVLTGFPFLELLNLSYGQIATVGPFGDLSKLKILDMRSSPIKNFPSDVFKGLKDLEEVHTTNYKMCCPAILPEIVHAKNCHAPKDEVSSCDNLLGYDVYRVFLWLLSSIAIFGNCSTFIVRLCTCDSSSKTGFSVFVMSLSLADFLMGVYLAVIGAADQVYKGTYLWNDKVWKHSWVCSLAGFLSLLSSEVSALTICLITLDRFIVLRFPFSKRRFQSCSAMMTCVLVWATGITIATVPLLPVTQSWEFYSQTGICIPLPITRFDFPGQTYSFSIMIVFNFVLFLLIAAGQAAIFWSVRTNSVTNHDRKRKSRELLIAKRLALVVLSDFLCWFPIGLLGLLAAQGFPVPADVNVGIAIFVLPFNSALNPFLYTLNAIMERRRQRAQLKMSKELETRIRTEMTAELHTTIHQISTRESCFKCQVHPTAMSSFKQVLDSIENAGFSSNELNQICRRAKQRVRLLSETD